MHRKRARRIFRIWEKSVSWVLPGKKNVGFRDSSWPDEFVHYGRRAVVVLRADDVKAVSIERWYLSPYVEKPLNSKLIKSFVPELRSRKCFFVFRDFYVISICALWTFHTYPYVTYWESIYCVSSKFWWGLCVVLVFWVVVCYCFF